jgi:multidrug transporter EmrE-like cation transporter
VLAFANRGTGLSIDAVLSVWFVVSLSMYGVAFILYSRSLSRIPLSIAYPIFVGLSLIVVTFASFIWLDYELSVSQIGGMALIFCGIILVSSSSGDHEKAV